GRPRSWSPTAITHNQGIPAGAVRDLTRRPTTMPSASTSKSSSLHSPDCRLAEAGFRTREALSLGRFLCGAFPYRKGGSISGQLTFARYTLMWFIHALDAIFELTAVVRKLLSHLIEAAWQVATERGPDGDDLADFELVGGHRFLDLGRRWCNTLDLHSPVGRFGEIRSQRSYSLSQFL